MFQMKSRAIGSGGSNQLYRDVGSDELYSGFGNDKFFVEAETIIC